MKCRSGGISSDSAIFAKIESFREINNITFLNYNLLSINKYNASYGITLYQILWTIPLVFKGLGMLDVMLSSALFTKSVYKNQRTVYKYVNILFNLVYE